MIRIGVIGVGAIGRDHIQRINNQVNGATVVAVNDVNKDFAQKYAKEIGATFYETGEELVASDEVDAIVVTSIDETHQKFVLEALKYDKYVFCEKPLAVEPDGCLEIVNEEIKKDKRLVQVGFMRRYDRGYKEVKEQVKNGKLGEILMVHCAHRNESSGEGYDTPMAIENTAVHEVDTLRWLLEEEFVSAQVILPKKQTKHSGEDLHDPQFVILETESGTLIDIEIFVNCQFGYDIKCDVVCEEGEVGLTNPIYYHVKTQEKDSTRVSGDWKERFITAYDDEFQIWVDGMKENNITGPTAWDGYMASATTYFCSKARESGQKEAMTFAAKPSFYK